MEVVYIAGPFRGPNTWEIEQNIRRAEALALEVWRAGAVAICPHTNTRFFQGAAPDDVWLKGYLEVVGRCDAVLLTSDYLDSEGAISERNKGLLKGKWIFNAIGAENSLPSEFIAWLKNEIENT